MSREYSRRKRQCAIFRVRCAMAKQIWAFLKGHKNGRKWESFVGYTYLDLKNALQSKFTGKMSWKNYGTYWEIDHIVPKSWFPNTEEGTRSSWALTNLQPQLCSVNRAKGNRFAG